MSCGLRHVHVHPPVSPDFARLFHDQLAQLHQRGVAFARAAIRQTQWHALHTPGPADLAQLTPPPQPGQMLLGRFEPWPEALPAIKVYERSLRALADKERRPLRELVYQTLVHELQHRFGVNHVYAGIPEQPAQAAAYAAPVRVGPCPCDQPI